VDASKEKPVFEVGQWVVLPIAGTRWDVQIVEDMGRLGVNGERLYSILVPQEEGAEPILRDAAESHLVPATRPSEPRSAQHS
jgi:hypothetical protein